MDRRHLSPILDAAFRALKNDSELAIVVYDQNLEVLTANEAAEALFRVPVGRMIGLPLAELLPELGRGSVRRKLRHVIEQSSRRPLGRLMAPLWPAIRDDGGSSDFLEAIAAPCSAGSWKGGAIGLHCSHEYRSLAREPEFSWTETVGRSCTDFPAWEDQCGILSPLVGSTPFERALRTAARRWRAHDEDSVLLALAPDALESAVGRASDDLLRHLLRHLVPHLPAESQACLRGNTFLVLLPVGSPISSALDIGQRFATSLRVGPAGSMARVTLGAGIAAFSQLRSAHPPTARELQELACAALHEARGAGQSKVTIHGHQPTTLAA